MRFGRFVGIWGNYVASIIYAFRIEDLSHLFMVFWKYWTIKFYSRLKFIFLKMNLSGCRHKIKCNQKRNKFSGILGFLWNYMWNNFLIAQFNSSNLNYKYLNLYNFSYSYYFKLITDNRKLRTNRLKLKPNSFQFFTI